MAKKKEPASEVQYWLSEIASSKRREKDFRKDGEDIIAIYSGERCDQIPFNILFSNVETLLPAIFSQTPRPVVQRRFKDDDPIGRAASTAAQRMLEFLCDTNVEGYETFDQSMRYATLDGLLPGRGITSVKYDAEVLEGEDIEMPVVQWEHVCTESKQWNKVYFGYAKKWSKVPWIAYEEYLDEEEATRLFGDKVAKKIEYTTGEEDEDEEEKGVGTGGRDEADREYGERKTALVYQIWDKSGGKVIRYISPAYHDGFLLVQDDPLKLTGFFNCPRPIQFIEKSSNLTPTAMYKLYENQAKELNNITRRIQKVVTAIKVRGVYDGQIGKELEQIFNQDDNGLVPAEAASSLATEKGFDNAIWFIPIDKLIIVLQQLIVAREQCKRVIYEITGVSDIVRGQSVASETLGAQKIKEAWGTMRLKRLQKAVQVYCRDTLRIMIEIAAGKMSEETWARATGLPFVTGDQKAQAEMVMQAAQAQGMQPDPQTIQILQSPAWPDILKVLRDDLQRAYRIDIETNSTIDPEATEDQKHIADFMNAMGQMLAGLTPMIEKGAMPFEAAKAMMLEVVRRFRFGTEVEDELKAMQPPQPQGNPEADAAKAEMAQAQQEAQMHMAEVQQKNQLAMQQMQAEMQQKVIEFQAEMRLENQKIAAKADADKAAMIAELAVEKEKLQYQQRIEQMKMNTQRDTELKKAALQAAAQIEIAKINATVQAQTAVQDGERSEKSEAMMSAIMETQTRLLETLAKPKIGKLSNGKEVRIEIEGA